MRENRIHNLHYEKFQDGTVKCIEDEIPFDVPEGWAWSRLETISSEIGDGLHGTPEYTDSSDYYFINGNNLFDGKIVIKNDTKQVSASTYIRYKKSLSASTVFLSINGTIGNVAFYNNEQVILGKSACYINLIDVNKEYLKLVLESLYFQKYADDNVTGSTIKNLGLAAIRKFLVPIPCTNEVIVITQECGKLLSYISSIEKDKEDVAQIIKFTKSKILDLAIRGKLVPQDPNDEPASVLLERIRAEKEELIKQGKIKRDKKESIIFRGDDNSYYQNVGAEMIDISDELPFEIPDSWCWSKLKNIVIINPRNKLDDDMEVAFIPMPLIEEGYSGNHSFEIRKWKDIKSGFTHFKDGDVGIAKITPCFENRKSVVFKNLCNGYGAGTTELHVLRPYKDTILAEFLLIYAKTQRFIEDGKQTFSGAVGQQRIGKEYIETVYFPIPPLQEQQRIIKHINNLFNYLNVIEAALS